MFSHSLIIFFCNLCVAWILCNCFVSQVGIGSAYLLQEPLSDWAPFWKHSSHLNKMHKLPLMLKLHGCIAGGNSGICLSLSGAG